jgi:hypothetical protein
MLIGYSQLRLKKRFCLAIPSSLDLERRVGGNF